MWPLAWRCVEYVLCCVVLCCGKGGGATSQLMPALCCVSDVTKTAALLTLLLRSDFLAEAANTPGAVPRRIHGYAYAPPPIVDEVCCLSLI